MTAADWISVKERLPEQNAVLLCLCNKWGYFAMQIFYFYRETGRFMERMNGKDMTMCVTHWMELPEEPEEETP